MNVAPTFFSCMIIGMMVYKNGPHIIYASLLFISSLICFFLPWLTLTKCFWRLKCNLNLRSWNTVKHTSALAYNPMISLWFDGALEKAVNTDQRSRYDTLSDFFLT